MQITLALLGPMELTWANQPISLGSMTTRALVAYLALEADRPHARERVAALLWPDRAQAAAFNNLRQALARVRQALPEPAYSTILEVTQHSLRFKRDVAVIDAVQFGDLLAACAVHSHADPAACPDCIQRMGEAAGLYRGELLQGLFLPESQPFDEWLLFKREELHRQALEVLYTLTRGYEAAADYPRMRQYAARQLLLEPWREEAHMAVMRALAAMGQRGAALAQYEACHRVLEEELGIEPSPETTALYKRIKAGERLSSHPEGTSPRSHAVERGSSAPIARMPAREDGTASPAMEGGGYPAGVMRSLRPDWGEAPETGRVYGRSAEAAQLEQWLVRDHSRVVVLLGIGGVGKTTLAAAVVRAVAAQFDAVIWRSLRNAPPLDELLRALLHPLSGHSLPELPPRLDDQLALLFDYLGRYRSLLVLDNLESILAPGQAGAFSPGYEPYGQLVQGFAEIRHSSCLLLTSRERPTGLARLEEDLPVVRALRLQGLDPAAGKAMLAARGLPGQAAGAALVERYSGNPLALKLVAQTVQELFLGDIGAFLQAEAPIFDDIRTVLDQQFGRLAPLEQELLTWLAIEREPVTFPALRANLVQPGSPRDFVEALRALQRRSLLEQTAQHAPGRVEQSGGAAFTLQNVIMEYVTERLVDGVCREIEAVQPDLLNRYALLKAQAKEYVRQSQARLILQPIAERLVARLSQAEVEERLRRLLGVVRAQRARAGYLLGGYTGGNILNLLLHLRVDVRGYDFSGLSVWQAYLRGVSMPEVSFAGSDLTGTTFTDAFRQCDTVAFSPNGQLLAGGTAGYAIHLWRVADWQLHGILRGHTNFVRSVAFSPDGSTLASAGADGAVVLWDIASGQLRHTLEGHTGWARSAVFSPDGTLLASAGDDSMIRLWDPHTGRIRHTLAGDSTIIYSIAFRADGKLLAGGSADKVHLWDVRAGRMCGTLAGHTGVVHSVAFSPDGAFLASGSADRTIRLWEVSTGRVRRIWDGHTAEVGPVAFSADGGILASGSADRTVRLWDMGTGDALHTLGGHTGTVRALAFSPDDALLASGSTDQTVRLWDPRTGDALHTLYGYSNEVFAALFSPDGTALASSHSDWLVRVWEVSGQGARVCRMLPHPDNAFTVAFDPAGTLLASGSDDHAVRQWDVRTGHLLRTLRGHRGNVWSVACSPDGSRLASAGADQTVRIWDVRNGQLLHTLHGHSSGVWSVAFSPDGTLLASGSMDHTVRLWDARTAVLRATLEGHAREIESVAFSPDNTMLASGSEDQTVRLWDFHTGQLIHTLCGHTNGIWCVVFSPDGTLLASSSEDQTVRLWEVATGRALRTLEGHTNEVLSVAFSPGGETLVSASGDETIRLWDVATGMCLNTLRAEDPYVGMDISGVMGITAAQKAALKALGAVEDDRFLAASR